MPVASTIEPTVRIRLARLAAEAVRAEPRVRTTLGPDGRWQTDDGGLPIPGVVAAVAGSAGRFEVMLHVDVLWPVDGRLDELADGLRLRIDRAAASAGLDRELGPIGVWMHDVLEPGDVLDAAAASGGSTPVAT